MLLVGTGNAHKLDEIRQILQGTVDNVIGSDGLPNQDPVVEDGETFLANAAIKAREFARRTLDWDAEKRPRWVIADDSGLAVDALGGRPGVFSARYAGEGCNDDDNNRKLLSELKDVAENERGAHFVCALVCCEVGPEPKVVFEVEGRCPGRIAYEARGAEGFGYDPLFIEESTGKTFAELPSSEKNLLSHRARAMKEFRSWLETQL